ncbi:MAG: class II aldolase [Sedimentisphaerales bacterium]|nr:class II aldolase [Sedimentisphaerales bacterium]
MNQALADLIKISRETGADPTLVQGGGGNTSVKTADGKYMYIKASGTALKDMSEKVGWRRLRLETALSVVKDKEIAQMPPQKRELKVVDRLLEACDDNVKVEARPSVEAHLHAWLDKCVIHLHPSSAGAFANARNGRAKLEKLFKAEKLPPLWVPYTDPGYMLAKRIAGLVERYQKEHGSRPAILFLEKHGLFVTAPAAGTALRLVRRVIRLCNSKLKQPKKAKPKPVSPEKIDAAMACIDQAYTLGTGEKTDIWYYYNGAIEEFMLLKDAGKMLVGCLTPDELVYSSGPAMWVEKCDARSIAKRLKKQIAAGKKHSAAFLVKGVGLVAAGTEKMAPTIRDIVLYSIFIRTNAARMGGILTLNKRQEEFINNWESEAFRKKLADGKR